MGSIHIIPFVWNHQRNFEAFGAMLFFICGGGLRDTHYVAFSSEGVVLVPLIWYV